MAGGDIGAITGPAGWERGHGRLPISFSSSAWLRSGFVRVSADEVRTVVAAGVGSSGHPGAAPRGRRWVTQMTRPLGSFLFDVPNQPTLSKRSTRRWK